MQCNALKIKDISLFKLYKRQIKLKLYKYSVPEIFLNSIFEISTDKLFDSGYDTLLFDLDNTIISYSENIIDIKTSKFLKSLEKKFNIVIISNSPNSRVLKACKQFGLKFISSAKKPFKIHYPLLVASAYSGFNEIDFL